MRLEALISDSQLRLDGPRTLVHRLGLAVLLATCVVAGPASGQAQVGYYTGAFATVGEHGCDGAVGQGVNPTGGCTPGTFLLAHSTAYVNGIRGAANYSTATADLASASLQAAAIFPLGSGNLPQGTANLFETFIVTGALAGPTQVTVHMTIDSTVSDQLSLTGNEMISASLTTVAEINGLSASYSRTDLTSPGAAHAVISTPVLVDDLHRIFRVTGVLTATGPGTHQNSAYSFIDIELPDGLGWTSASGVFGSRVSVPEPSANAMLAAGLVAIAFVRRRVLLTRRG